ncbi:rCG59612, isoform CRA_b, partial [Rattus norvegicus]
MYLYPAMSFFPAQACSLPSRTPLPPCTWALLRLSPPLPSPASLSLGIKQKQPWAKYNFI